MKKGVEKEDNSFWSLFLKVYAKGKEEVNLFLLGLSLVFSFISSSLEAISLGLIVPLVNAVIDPSKVGELGPVAKVFEILAISDTTTMVLAVAVMILGAVILKNVFAYASGYAYSFVVSKLNYTMRMKVMREYLKRDFLFFSKSKIGDLNYNLNLSGSLGDIISTLYGLTNNFLLCLAYGIVMIYLAPQILVFIFLTFIPTYLVLRWLRELIRETTKKQILVGAKLQGKTYELLSAINLIKLYATEDEERKLYEDLSEENRLLGFKIGRKSALAGAIQEPLLTASIMGLAAVAFIFFLDSTRGGIAGFMVFFLVLKRFEYPAQALMKSITLLPAETPKLERFLSVFKTEDWMFISSGNREFSGLKKQIEFKNVEFRYEQNSEVILKNINMTIEKGKTTALIGESGSGKSTLAALIPRMFDCKKGKILVDGIDIKEYNLYQLRKSIGVVSQDVAVLSRTIKENIKYGLKREVSDQEVIDAAKKAQLHRFIEGLPNKYDTMLGERGVNLSGGQRQRISIARALLKNPSILILDEATSALDTETEKLIQTALDKAAEGRTVLAIAHRLSTIQNADKVVVLEEGKVVEQGKFKELVRKKGKFYNYWKLQSGS